MMPPDDLTNSDGNCAIVKPVAIPLYLNPTPPPGAVACSYPSTGWIPGGNWSSTVLANSGDCARIVDLAGCEVFGMLGKQQFEYANLLFRWLDLRVIRYQYRVFIQWL